MIADTTYIQNQAGEINAIKDRYQVADKSEWPLVFHAINSSIAQVVEIIERIIDLDSRAESADEKLIAKELSRNIFFARQLIKDFQANSEYDQGTLEQFSNDINTLEVIFKASYEFQAEGDKILESLGCQRFKKVEDEVLIGGPSYFIDDNHCCELAAEDDLTFANEITRIMSHLKESNAIYKNFPQIDEIAIESNLRFDGEVFLEANTELTFFRSGDSSSELAAYDGDGNPVYEHIGDKAVPDEMLFEIESQLGSILDAYYASNKNLGYQINLANSEAGNASQEGQIYFSYELKSKSPVD